MVDDISGCSVIVKGFAVGAHTDRQGWDAVERSLPCGTGGARIDDIGAQIGAFVNARHNHIGPDSQVTQESYYYTVRRSPRTDPYILFLLPEPDRALHGNPMGNT